MRRFDIEKRINEVYSLITKGAHNTEIVEYCAENFGVKKRRAEGYIRLAKQKIKELLKNDLLQIRSEALARYNELYRLAVEEKDYRTAAYIQSRIDRITGIEIYVIENKISLPETLRKFFLDKIQDKNKIIINPNEAVDVKQED